MLTDKRIADGMPGRNNLLMDVYFFELLLDTAIVPFNFVLLQTLINNGDDILCQLAFRPISTVINRTGFQVLV